jgi:hypothetical protein
MLYTLQPSLFILLRSSQDTHIPARHLPLSEILRFMTWRCLLSFHFMRSAQGDAEVLRGYKSNNGIWQARSERYVKN